MNKILVTLLTLLSLSSYGLSGTNTMKGANVVPSGSSLTVNSGGDAMLNGTLNGTPTSGTLNLGAVSLKVKPSGSGAIPRDVASQIRDISVNVVTFGADPTGAADSSGNVNSAKALGFNVYFPPGAYKFSSTITTSEGQRYFGAGERVTRIFADDGVTAFIVSGNRVTFEDMDIGGNSPSHLAACGIQLSTGAYANEFTANRVRFLYAAVGLKNDHGFDASKINNCTFSDCTVGTTQTTNVDDFLILDTTFSGCTTSGIDVNGGNVHAFHGVYGGNATSVRFLADGGKATLDHCYLETASSGQYIDGQGHYNNILNLVYNIFGDGSTLVHVANFNNLIGNISWNTVLNNPTWNKVRVANSHGSADIRSENENAIIDYNSVYNYIPTTHQTVGDGNEPTATATSPLSYTVNTWSGTTGTIALRTYIKRQTGASTWIYVAHDGLLAGKDVAVEGDLSLSDITTANASTTKHGFVPKLPNDATVYYDGSGSFSSPRMTYAAALTSPSNRGFTTLTNVTDLTIANVPVGDYYVSFEGGQAYGPGDAGWKWDIKGGTAVFSSFNPRYNAQVGWMSPSYYWVAGGDSFSSGGAAGVTISGNIYDGEDWTTIGSTFTLAFHYTGMIHVSTAGSVIIREANHSGSGDAGQLKHAQLILIKK